MPFNKQLHSSCKNRCLFDHESVTKVIDEVVRRGASEYDDRLKRKYDFDVRTRLKTPPVSPNSCILEIMHKRGPYRKRNGCCTMKFLEEDFKFDNKSNCLSPQPLFRPVPQSLPRFTGAPGYMNVFLHFLKNNFSVEIDRATVEEKRDLHKNAARLRLEKVACRDRTYNTINVVMVTDGDGVVCNIINPGITSTGVKTISQCLGEGLSPFHGQESSQRKRSFKDMMERDRKYRRISNAFGAYRIYKGVDYTMIKPYNPEVSNAKLFEDLDGDDFTITKFEDKVSDKMQTCLEPDFKLQNKIEQNVINLQNLWEESFECKTVVLEDCKSDESNQFEPLIDKIKSEDYFVPFRGFAPKMFSKAPLMESIIARLQSESVATPRPMKCEVFDI